MIRIDSYPGKITLLAIVFAMPVFLHAQTTIVQDAPKVNGTTVVIAGKEFNRSGYHNFFWGSHYRKEWNTPVRVPNFYIDTAIGGLTPYAKGGGRQSTTLRLRSKDGGEYVLRSINKNFAKALPEATRGTFVANIAKDQSSVAHPYSAITIVPMAEAAGIYHTIPKIVFVPVQSALGVYNDEYGDQLYLFEQRPDENQESSPNFGNSKNVIGSDKLFEHIYKDNDNHVDQVAFLRARLFDMFIGDWGRHPDNWRWAKFDEGKNNIYKPVPRDRDQAYSIFDGFYPSIAGKVYKPVQGFKHTIKKVPDWNSTADRLDKMFLNDLEKEVWVKQAAELQAVLTDALIESSIRLLPPEIFSISGDKLISKLKSRRDKLDEYAMDYYDYLSRYVDLAGTEDRELFYVNRLPGDETEVSIYKITKENERSPVPYYSRFFKKNETKEIRIYGLDKEDVIEIKGVENKGTKVRIIDPKGNDSITFERDDLHSKIKISSGKKFEYDTLHQKKFDLSLRPVISSSRYKVFDNDPLKLFPRTGIKVLTSITYIGQPWRRERYENVHHLCFNYGIFRRSMNVGYVGRFGRRVFGKWDFLVKARVDAPAVENYFGVGNNTELNTDLIAKKRTYYRTYSRRLYGSVGIERDFAKYHHAEFFAFYQSVQVQQTNGHLITDEPLKVNPAVFDRNHYGGIEGGYSFTNINDQLAPTRGFGFNIGGGYFKHFKDGNDDFIKTTASVYAYLPLGNRFSLASRVGGGTISGDAPYYYMNTLGGAGTGEMRGYDRERFYGKHSLHFNNDLRWIFPTRNWLFSGRAGLLGFYDIGRVWQPGEVSDQWHDSYGGGILLVPYEKFSVTATYGVSKEGSYMHFKAGFFF